MNRPVMSRSWGNPDEIGGADTLADIAPRAGATKVAKCVSAILCQWSDVVKMESLAELFVTVSASAVLLSVKNLNIDRGDAFTLHTPSTPPSFFQSLQDTRPFGIAALP